MTGPSPHLDGLADKLEHLVGADPKERWAYPSYTRVQQAYVSQYSNGDAGKDEVLEFATPKMEAFVKATTTPRISSANTLLALEKWNTMQNQAVHLPVRCPAVYNLKEKKDAFLICMQAWLKRNFVHPFPDDVMLNRLATFMIFQLQCITVNKSEADILEVNSPSDYRQNLMRITTDKITHLFLRSTISNAVEELEGGCG
mmetsp:Transcript_33071/g.69420  ORF Transcript_33071/g.69420 Transcript_33071/m.69420 type:complete len:200 (-) Transcript_33071:273-872(-)